jgi:hypothetical protein
MMGGMRTIEITRIDPLSTTKVAAILGVLWALLGWIFSGFVILMLLQSSTELAPEGTPSAFSIGGLVSGVIGGCIGGALSGYLGSHVYNVIAQKIGGISVDMRDATELIPKA